MLQLNQTCEKQKDPEVHFPLSLYRETLVTHHDQVLLFDQSPVTDYCSKILENGYLILYQLLCHLVLAQNSKAND